MKYKFHVGDYVETKQGDIGIITEIASNVFWWYCVCGKGPLSKMHEQAFFLRPDVVVESAFNRIGKYNFTNETRSDNMKYNFHVGDYVETKNDARGYVEDVDELIWRCTQSSNDYMYVAGHPYFIPVGFDSCFNQIGQYDFTKKGEDKNDDKIEPLVKSRLLESADGEDECYFDSREVIKKINELVEAFNQLKEKVNGMAQS